MLGRSLIAILLAMVLATVVYAADTSIGSDFPSLQLKDLEGTTHNLSSNNRPLIVTFFAAWSETCLKELKALSKLKDSLKDKIDIIAVSFDSNQKELTSCLLKNKIDLLVLFDSKLISPEKYKILVIPTTYLVKANGKIKNIFVDYDKNVIAALKKSLFQELKN